MRALPLTDKARPGGRPRRSRAPSNAFAQWLQSCGKTPEEIADELKCSVSSVYNARNAYFKPGRALAHKIQELTTDPETGVSAVPMTVWQAVKARPRRGKQSKAA
jgi:hypothetical protein